MRHGVTTRVVGVLALVSAVSGWLVTRLWYLRAGLPATPSWVAAVLVLLVAVALIVTSTPIRAAALADPPRPIARRRAVGVLAAAQASALTGACLSGWNLGYLATLAVDLDALSVRTAAGSVAALAVAGAVLTGAGLWAQSMCRVPPEPSSG